MPERQNPHIKLIPVDKLRVGMFVHDINIGWMEHNFITNKFSIADDATLRNIKGTGVKNLYIDISKGLDCDTGDGQDEDDVKHDIDENIIRISEEKSISPATPPTELGSEIDKAQRMVSQASTIMKSMFSDMRMGKQIRIEDANRIVDGLVEAIFRKQDAVTPLLRLKDHDEYTFKHSVSVCALMIAFSKGLGLPQHLIREIAVGALLHDVGKADVPDEILNKPAKLTDAEFSKMKSHVVQSIIILQHTEGITQTMLDIAGQHHERHDGTGYPNKLKGDEISFYGKMGAIVDVYDAITSDRVYHKGMPPTEALRKILEWSKHHFDPQLVHTFIKVLGIYPTGSFAMLDNNKIGIVKEQNQGNLLSPTMLLFYDAKRQRYFIPEAIDLSKAKEKILMHIDPAEYKFDVERWTTA